MVEYTTTSVFEGWGMLGFVIGFLFLVLLAFVLFLYFNKKCSSSFYCCDEIYILPQKLRSNGTRLDHNEKKDDICLPLQQSSYQPYTSIDSMDVAVQPNKPENEVTATDKRLSMIRNRSNFLSGSSESSCSVDDENSAVCRRRDFRRFGRAFSLQDDSIIQEQSYANGQDQDCIVVLQQDQLSDIQSVFSDNMSGIVGKCGLLEVAFAYDAPFKKMTIHILQGRDIPVKDSGRPSYTQVHVVLLPGRKQKQRSKIRTGENPQFIESITFNRITPEDVNNMSVRFRLYGCERMRRQRLIGECIISFSNINLQLQSNMWLPLEPRANTAINAAACEVLSQSESIDSAHSTTHGGVAELLLGLSYNGLTGRLAVEIVKGSHFRDISIAKPPDTYVKLMLLSSTGQELAHSKTSVRKSQPNPLFKEIFVYQVALFQLCDVTLMVIVYNKKSIKRKERIGWFSLGRNNTTDEELSHWEEMSQMPGEQLSRWHVLVQS